MVLLTLCHEEVYYLQPMIPPKRFDIFSPDLGVLRRPEYAHIFLKKQQNEQKILFTTRNGFVQR